jgi:hypothetical protein
MPFPCLVVPLRVYTVYSPFDLHSAALFDSHLPSRSYAVSLPCHDYAFLKATSQGHGTAWHESSMGTTWYVWISIGRPATACGRPARVRRLPATTRTFTKDTALTENGRVAAWHVRINAAEERHGICEVALEGRALTHSMHPAVYR